MGFISFCFEYVSHFYYFNEVELQINHTQFHEMYIIMSVQHMAILFVAKSIDMHAAVIGCTAKRVINVSSILLDINVKMIWFPLQVHTNWTWWHDSCS